jgi:uncharacterized metal-binding protein YceD (DUF177 family)
MMRLDISDVLREVGKLLPYDINEPPLVDEDVECTRPIQGKVTFNNTGGTLLVRGTAETSVALACSRCAQYFERNVELTLEEQFELRHVSAGPRTLQTVTVVEEDESPIAGKLIEGHIFNLTEMLRQYILLDQPTQPLPPELPDGRCSHCHLRPEEDLRRLAEEPDAEKTPVNPAFAKLHELLEQKREEP